METSGGRVRVRVVALVTRGDEVLVIEQSDATQVWYCFPGGALEHGETLEMCLARELVEELSLEVDVGPFIACGTYEEGNTTSAEIYFHCTPRGGAPVVKEAHIHKVHFLPIASLSSYGVYPREMGRDLSKLLKNADKGGVYYGRFA